MDSWSNYSKSEKAFGIAVSRAAPNSPIAAKDLRGLARAVMGGLARGMAFDALAPEVNPSTGEPYKKKAYDLPTRGRDQDPDLSGVSDPLTARGALHAHLSSCIDDPDARLVAHQLVERLCAAYGGAGEDNDPAAFSERNIRAGEMRESEAAPTLSGEKNYGLDEIFRRNPAPSTSLSGGSRSGAGDTLDRIFRDCPAPRGAGFVR